jgi:hypothetical protein
VTNYRLVFVPNFEISDAQIMQKQPKFIHEYFIIPLGMINRAEKQIAVSAERG